MMFCVFFQVVYVSTSTTSQEFFLDFADIILSSAFLAFLAVLKLNIVKLYFPSLFSGGICPDVDNQSRPAAGTANVPCP